MKPLTITLDQQIKEACRELAIRKRAYAKWVNSGSMSLLDAQLQIAAHEAICNTLKNIQDFTFPRGDLDKIQTITVEL